MSRDASLGDEVKSLGDDTRGAMHPTIHHLRILVLLTIVLAATAILVEVIV